jgi:hypothetical protein
MKTEVVTTHILNIRRGDVIRCADGFDRTICAADIRDDPFMGRTLWGDSYRLGYKPVAVLRFPKLTDLKLTNDRQLDSRRQ